MSAKPQPMAGQSDAADDLIAELAKLMAQDAKGDRPAEAAAPAFSVRIPGGDAAPAATPAPRFDFDRTTALAAEQPAPPAPAEPAAGPAPEETPEPFRFDFGLDKPKTPIAEAPVEPAPEPPAAADHDSIADLIAAELSNESEPAPEPAPQPVPAPPASRATSLPVSSGTSSGDKPAGPSLDTFNLRPAARPEQDRFKVPPVFGLSSRPAPAEPAASPIEPAPEAPAPVEPFAGLRQPAPSVAVNPSPAPVDDGLGRDPIDEIEHLIGRAMRVEFDKPAGATAEERPVASPALHNLATVAVPAAAAEPAAVEPALAPRALSGADEAILAAAEATGAQIGWVEAPEVDETEAVAPAPRRRRARGFTISRSLAGPLVAVALLLAAGLGLYWVLGLGRDSGPAPLLTADTSPVKETPAVPADASAPQSIVFNEINGVVPGAEEQLVSRDQADVNEVTQVPPPADVSEEGLANRKVRTVTVRPDGTIVSGDESVAGSTILPVDRPNVPEVPGAETASPELLASADPEPATPAATPAAEPEVTVTPVQPGSMVPAIDAAGNPLAGRTAPVPMQRPAGLVQATEPMVTAAAPTNAVNAVVAPAGGGNLLPPPPANSAFGTTPAATQPAATIQQPAAQQPAATANIPGAVEVDALPNSAPAYAQLASLRSEEEARQAAQNLVARFGPLFGGANMEVQRVDLGARGIYYRVRVPANSTSAAANICTNVVAAGGDCVAM